MCQINGVIDHAIVNKFCLLGLFVFLCNLGKFRECFIVITTINLQPLITCPWTVFNETITIFSIAKSMQGKKKTQKKVSKACSSGNTPFVTSQRVLVPD